ncbi:hypothetical protein I4U23_004119 [Adineta vaga]|nr:hypothetical protein I4U23_004119 [Adineta vaga]
MFSSNTIYNSDLSTYHLFHQLEGEFNQYLSTVDWRNNSSKEYFEISSDFVRNIIYPKMKQEAEILAEKLAKNASMQKDRWRSYSCTTLIHQIMEILFNKCIRRGSVPTNKNDLSIREQLIKDALLSNHGLRFSILMLPNRDLNKAKNDGYLPDLGETIVLLQLWSIIKAMLLVTEKYSHLLITIFNKINPSVRTIVDIQDNIKHMIKPKIHDNNNRSEYLNNGSRMDRLRDELNRNYDIINNEKAELLIRELARCNRTFLWFLQSIEEVFQIQTKSIRLFVVQDAHRYPCFDTDSKEHIEAYSTYLKQIALELNIHEHIILTSHANLEREYSYQQNLQMFIQLRNEIYCENFEKYSFPFYQRKTDLFACKTRESFLNLIDQLSLNKNISQLIEPILHGRNHPELINAQLSVSDELLLLAQIYQPQTNSQKRELLRQDLLFSSLINAIKYSCAYESQTATKNKYQLDDIQLLLPDTVRLSIHNKPSNCGQFLIKCGPNLHRQPWHGTAGLRLRSNKSSHFMTYEIRLSFEYKINNYIPIFIKKESIINENYLSNLVSIHQPIVWIHKDLIQTYVNDDLHRIFDRTNHIRMI